MTAIRRLAAILAADVAGHSRRADEEGTSNASKRCAANSLTRKSPQSPDRR
jgi:hypothetical protein